MSNDPSIQDVLHILRSDHEGAARTHSDLDREDPRYEYWEHRRRALWRAIELIGETERERGLKAAARGSARDLQAIGVALIATERRRQVVEEGWDAEHDDDHADGSLALAAAAYAVPESRRVMEIHKHGMSLKLHLVTLFWPRGWSARWWKPTPNERIRELVKAGALIAAEIDRLLRRES